MAHGGMSVMRERSTSPIPVSYTHLGFGTNGDQKWYVENGQVQFGYTGIASGYNKYGDVYKRQQ